MNDERYDRDLRAVLLEHAPDDVPDELRRRVMAVTVTRSTSDAARATRRPWLLWASAAAVILVVAGLGLRNLGPSLFAGLGGLPSPVTTHAPGSAVVSPPASAPATGQVTPAGATPPQRTNEPSKSVPPPTAGDAAACRGEDLTGSIVRWTGAAGSRLADLEITNHGASACFLQGTPQVQLVDAQQQVMIDSATQGASGRPHVGPSDAKSVVGPGGHVRTVVSASNYCGATPVLPLTVVFSLPAGAGQLKAVPVAGGSSADDVPPCLGPAHSFIGMDGWRPQ